MNVIIEGIATKVQRISLVEVDQTFARWCMHTRRYCRRFTLESVSLVLQVLSPRKYMMEELFAYTM